MSTHLSEKFQATKIFHMRLKILLKYCLDVNEGNLTLGNFENDPIFLGRLPNEPEILRDIASLCQKFPLYDSKERRSQLNAVCCLEF